MKKPSELPTATLWWFAGVVEGQYPEDEVTYDSPHPTTFERLPEEPKFFATKEEIGPWLRARHPDALKIKGSVGFSARGGGGGFVVTFLDQPVTEEPDPGAGALVDPGITSRYNPETGRIEVRAQYTHALQASFPVEARLRPLFEAFSRPATRACPHPSRWIPARATPDGLIYDPAARGRIRLWWRESEYAIAPRNRFSGPWAYGEAPPPSFAGMVRSQSVDSGMGGYHNTYWLGTA